MILYLCISTLILGNANGFLIMLYGIKAPLSPLILILSLVISLLVIVRTKNKYHFSFLLLLFFLISYLFIGTLGLSFYINEHDPRTNHINLYRKYIPTILLVFVFYKTTLYFHRAKFPAWLYYFTWSLLTVVATITAFGSEMGLASVYSFANKAFLEGSNREIGFFENPNEAGFQSCFALVFSLFMFMDSRFRFKPIYILTAAVSLYATYKTFSRAALLGSMVVILIYFIVHVLNLNLVKKGLKWRFLFLMGLMFYALSLGVKKYETVMHNLSPYQKKRIINSISLFSGEINSKGSANERLKVLKIGIVEIKNRPLFGSGIGAFNRLKNCGIGIHNTYLLVLGDSGIVPFILLILFIFYFFFRSKSINCISIKFLLLGVISVLGGPVFLTSHNGIEYRVGVALLGMAISIMETQCKYECQHKQNWRSIKSNAPCNAKRDNEDKIITL